MSLKRLSDPDLVASFSDLVVQEQENLADQIEHLAELERRKLFFEHSSLWAYLVDEKGFSDDEAVRRIRAARMIGRLPDLLDQLRAGRLKLTHLDLALGCAQREKLSDTELGELITALLGLSTRRARRAIATRYPRETDVVHEKIRPINAELSEVTFVASQRLLDRLDELRGLLAHSHPQLTLAGLIEVLAEEYRERHHPEARARRAAERTERKEAPAEVEVEVEAPVPERVISERFPSQPLVHALTLSQGYRCSYVDPVTGKACDSTFALEIDHRQPWCNGGRTELQNLRYLCRGHHRRVSYLDFGEIPPVSAA